MTKKNRKVCRVCDSDTVECFSLGRLPSGYPTDRPDNGTGWSAPYVLNRCEQCGLFQTQHRIPEDQLADENHYNSRKAGIVSRHDQNFVEETIDRFGLDETSRIVEIGCGDGQLLDLYYEKGYQELLGVEPSLHPAHGYDYPVIEDFFAPASLTQVEKELKEPSLVIANYVIELVPDIDSFFTALDQFCGEESRIVIEVPYLYDYIAKKRLDGFAHLRCNWFDVTSLYGLCKKHRFNLKTVENDPEYRGGTLRIVASKSGEEASELKKWIKKEDKLYERFFKNKQFRKTVAELREKICSFIAGYGSDSIVVYGAGLKASTCLNWLDLSEKTFAYAVDADPGKQNKYISGTRIPVRPVEVLKQEQGPVTVLNLAIDHSEEIENFLKQILMDGSHLMNVLPAPAVKQL